VPDGPKYPLGVFASGRTCTSAMRRSKPDVSNSRSRRSSADFCDPRVIRRLVSMGRNAGIVFGFWSGARDLNPGLAVPNRIGGVTSSVLPAPQGSALTQLPPPKCPLVTRCDRPFPGMRDPAVSVSAPIRAQPRGAYTSCC